MSDDTLTLPWWQRHKHPLQCVACGRPLCNDPDCFNSAEWTTANDDLRDPYCADSKSCRAEANA